MILLLKTPVSVVTPLDHHSGIDPYHVVAEMLGVSISDSLLWRSTAWNTPIHLAAVLPLVVLS